MAEYKINPINGVQTFRTKNSGFLRHDIAFRANGATAGTVSIRGKKGGSDTFEAITDGLIDLIAITSVQVSGSVAEFEITIAEIADCTSMTMTDTMQPS